MPTKNKKRGKKIAALAKKIRKEHPGKEWSKAFGEASKKLKGEGKKGKGRKRHHHKKRY